MEIIFPMKRFLTNPKEKKIPFNQTCYKYTRYTTGFVRLLEIYERKICRKNIYLETDRLIFTLKEKGKE